MADLIPAGILADMKMLVNDSLPDTCTNSSTGETHPCRVNRITREIHLHGLPSFMRVRTWRITMPTGVNVQAGHILASTLLGTSYTAISVENPVDNAVNTVVLTMLTNFSGGGGALVGKQIVSFRHPAGTVAPLTDIRVYIEPAAEDIKQYDLDPKLDWKLIYDGTLRYADGSPIAPNDQITWAFLPAPGFASISNIVTFFDPISYVCAYFKVSV